MGKRIAKKKLTGLFNLPLWNEEVDILNETIQDYLRGDISDRNDPARREYLQSLLEDLHDLQKERAHGRTKVLPYLPQFKCIECPERRREFCNA